MRLFLCGEAEDARPAAESLGRDLLEDLLAAGILQACGPDRVTAPFHMRLVRNLYLFSDYLDLDADSEAVMGAGETTAVLFTAGCPAARVDAALDLGCGAGTLTLLLAAHATEAFGTDINPRAVALARFNASVNGIANAAFACGDMYHPVAGRRFDVILSQPPYYPHTDGEAKVFLHGGERGDELAMRVVRGAPQHLTRAGRALIFAAWPEDRESIAYDSLRVLELRTNRRELNGTLQSMDVIEHAAPGRGWFHGVDIAADQWGLVTAVQVSQLLQTQELLQRAAPLRFVVPEGTVLFEEGTQHFLRAPLVGTVPVDHETCAIIGQLQAGERLALSSIPAATRAARRGWLAAV
ncbi:MAG TPA: methyltransferase [Bryobacteraceae bacterium]|nr:methyltransferase [Bryobacteraceae bacterium]